MAAASGHVKTYVTQEVESRIEAFIGIAFLEQLQDKGASFIDQRFLDGISDVLNRGPICLGKVDLFQRGVHFYKAAADPAIEIICVNGH